MRHGRTVHLILSESDFDFLQGISDQFGIKKSEFLRLLIQGLRVGESAMNKEGAKVEIGGYGLEFSQEYLESFVRQIEPILEGFGKGVKVTTQKTAQKPKKRRKMPFKAVA